jgi:hypothetical protein
MISVSSGGLVPESNPNQSVMNMLGVQKYTVNTELETRVGQLKASETDLKNLFYREQEARQVLEYDYKELAYECDKHMELHIASDHDLVNCYK